MKLKFYNKTLIPQIETGKPTIYVDQSGNFCLNQFASKLIGIDPEQINYAEIIQDEENPKDWYIALTNPETGFKMRKQKTSNKYDFNCGAIAKLLLKVLPKSNLGVTPHTATLLIGSEPVEFSNIKIYPIITSSYKPKNILK